MAERLQNLTMLRRDVAEPFDFPATIQGDQAMLGWGASSRQLLFLPIWMRVDSDLGGAKQEWGDSRKGREPMW